MKDQQSSRAFWILLITQTVSLLGSRMSEFAIGIWVTEKTGSVTPLSLMAVCGTVPMILLSNVAGVIVDRFDRGRVIMIANAGQAVSTLLLMASFWSGHFQLWHLYTLAAVQSAFGALLLPAFSSSITLLIDDKHGDRANAVNQVTGPLAGVVAPAVAAFLYAIVGVAGVIGIDMASFIIAGLAPLLIHIPRPAQTVEGKAMRGSLLKELTIGFRFLYSRKVLLLIFAFTAGVNFIYNGIGTMTTPYILARTGSKAALGFALSALNLGAILGAVLIGVWGGTRPRIHTIMIGLVLSALALIGYGVSRSPVALAVAMFAIMFPIPIVNAPFMSIMQAKTPPDIQGSVFATMGQLSMILSPLGSLLVGPLVDTVVEPAVNQPGWEIIAPLVGSQHGAGMGLLAVIGGLVLVILTAIVYALPVVRHLERDLPDFTPSVAEPETAAAPATLAEVTPAA